MSLHISHMGFASSRNTLEIPQVSSRSTAIQITIRNGLKSSAFI